MKAKTNVEPMEKNPIYVIRQMVKRMVLEEEIPFDISNLSRIISEAEFHLYEVHYNGKTYYKVDEMIPHTLFISGPEEESSIAIAGDIHSGFINSYTSWDLHDKFLDEGVDKGVVNFIYAGDICEGTAIYKGQNILCQNVTSEGQANIFFNKIIGKLRKYKEDGKKIRLIFISGNHDLMFPAIGQDNPVELLVNMLKNEGIDAYYISNFVANVIIGGACYRVVHLDDHYGKYENVPCLKYYHNVEENITVRYKDDIYLIAGLICGHVHKRFLYNPRVFDYSKKWPRKRSETEVFLSGYRPLFVAQAGTLKKHVYKKRKFGHFIKCYLDGRGVPQSYEVL